MIIKAKLFLILVLTYAIFGCGEDYISGVTKGGTGNGSPPDSESVPIKSGDVKATKNAI